MFSAGVAKERAYRDFRRRRAACCFGSRACQSKLSQSAGDRMDSIGVGGMLLLYWGVVLGVIVAVLNAVWRVVRAHERIASALESIAAKR